MSAKRWSIVVSINPESKTPAKEEKNITKIRQVGGRNTRSLHNQFHESALLFRNKISHQLQIRIEETPAKGVVGNTSSPRETIKKWVFVPQFVGALPLFHLSNQFRTVAVKSSPL